MSLGGSAEVQDIRHAFMGWYDKNRRDLPWRRTTDPWAIWVSEVMLQQTRVDSVIDYYHRFLERFPTPSDMAEAELDEVLGMWAGLGYYARARNLHRAAQQVVERHGGQVPNDPVEFEALTGVGRYTCGAVQSIAFGHELPVVDGNVVRVLSRLHFIAEDPAKAAVKKRFWSHAEDLVHGPRPGDLNQAIMELGATVCTPRSPRCLLCPLMEHCVVRREGDPESVPLKKARKARPRYRLAAGLCTDSSGAIWIGKRPTDGLLGGMWSIPMVRSNEAQFDSSLQSMGLSPLGEPVVVEHAFTHQVWEIHAYPTSGCPRSDDFVEWRQVDHRELSQVGLDGPSLKALRALGIEVAHRRGAGRKPRN